MTIEQLGSLGELIAAVATVVTLAYLALQIRQNTHATKAASFHAVSDSMNHVNVAVAQDDELARIWVDRCEDRAALAPASRHRFDMLLLSYFHVFETVHYQAKVGAGDPVLVAAEEKSLRALLSTPGVQSWWRENPYAFGPEFRRHVGSVVSSHAVSA